MVAATSSEPDGSYRLLGRVLSSMFYDVSGFDPLVFVPAPLVLAGASLFASYLPARRATRVNPLAALRQG